MTDSASRGSWSNQLAEREHERLPNPTAVTDGSDGQISSVVY